MCDTKTFMTEDAAENSRRIGFYWEVLRKVRHAVGPRATSAEWNATAKRIASETNPELAECTR